MKSFKCVFAVESTPSWLREGVVTLVADQSVLPWRNCSEVRAVAIVGPPEGQHMESQ